MKKQWEESGLTQTGRLFGGMMNNIKGKKPFYLSDFKDAASVQILASFIFVYFACLTPIVTFGELLGDAIGNYRKVASFNTPCLEPHAGFFKLLMKGIFN